MLQEFKNFQNRSNFRFLNSVLNDIIKNYDFLIFHKNSNDQNVAYFENFKKSEVIIVNLYNNLPNKSFFMISFKQTIILIQNHDLLLLESLFRSKKDLKICFLTDISKNYFRQSMKDQLIFTEIKLTAKNNEDIKEIESKFEFYKSENFKSISNIKDIWLIIRKLISAYFIMQGYCKSNPNRIENFYKSQPNIKNDHELLMKNKIQVTQDNCYAILRNIGQGSTFIASLCFHYKNEELFVLKKSLNDSENTKLIEREIKNYEKIHHPFFPVFYDTDKSKTFLAIEYINGKELLKIKEIQLSINEKITIIFELMLAIEYLHRNGLILRDLKPDNIMVDNNKTIVLIDFNRMVTIESAQDDSQKSIDFSEIYTANEVQKGNFSYECDIYSLGKIIYFIMKEKEPNDDNISKNFSLDNEFTDIIKIVQKCILNNPKERPKITDLILDFYILYHSRIQIKYVYKFYDMNLILNENNFWKNYEKINEISFGNKIVTNDIKKAIQFYLHTADQNDPEILFRIGAIYMDNFFVNEDIKKGIYYYEKAAQKGNVKALFKLGNFYSSKPDASLKDIYKGIDYYILAAEKGDKLSQCNLGVIYLGILSPNIFDIDKAIKYLKYAADQNYDEAQYYLGNVYIDPNFNRINVNKAIQYFTPAANQNNINSQYNLGLIYSDFSLPYIYNIEKAIFYFTKAANQNHLESQYNLGIIYLKESYKKQDIVKSISYFELAANQNDLKSQLFLGKLYFYGKYVDRDIDKAVKYFKLAANQNHPDAQCILGIIYYHLCYGKQNIGQSIYYLKLASDQNHGNASLFLSKLYYDGYNVKHDIRAVVFYLDRAIKQNVIEAYYNMGMLILNGVFLDKNINKAIEYIKHAADKEMDVAQYLLGMYYFEGKLLNKNIDKALEYLQKAANQNHSYALYNLGCIYYYGINVPKHIKRAKYYFKLSSKANIPEAQYNLGYIYYNESKKNHLKNMNKAIKYFTLAADSNLMEALCTLGFIYQKNNDIIKASYYYKLAADKGLVYAQIKLGIFYYEGKLLHKNVQKAINYLKKAAEQNNSDAQYSLGIIYLKSELKDVIKSIHYLSQASENGNSKASFIVGFYYHQRKNYKKAIHFYNNASSFNYQYAKNNLGIIYKYGFDETKSNIGNSIIYFDEAIKQKQDIISMYNLANVYFYYTNNNKEAINLLIESAKKGFPPSKFLLCLVLIIEYDFDEEQIKQQLIIHNMNECYYTIKCLINDIGWFEEQYKKYKNIDFSYDNLLYAIPTNDVLNQNTFENEESTLRQNITQDFIDGFEE